MRTIILSPHLDDAAFSCGGWIWERVQGGEEVTVCTIFAGSPSGIAVPPFAEFLEGLWGFQGHAMAGRRAEDEAACRLLGCDWRHLEYLDGIYRYLPGKREPLIHNLDDLSNPVLEEEYSLIDRITARVNEIFPDDRQLLAPLGMGGHVDHRITRFVAERLHRNLSYYLDIPYAGDDQDDLLSLLPAGAKSEKYELSEQGLRVWQQSISTYASQLGSFWNSIIEMEAQMKSFADSPLGCCLWRT